MEIGSEQIGVTSIGGDIIDDPIVFYSFNNFETPSVGVADDNTGALNTGIISVGDLG